MKKIIVLSSLSVALLTGCSDNIKVETSTLNEKQSYKTVKTDGYEVAHNPQNVDSEASNKSNLNLDDVISKPVTAFQLGQVAVQEFKPELDPQIIRNLQFSIQSKPENSALTNQSILVSDHHVSIKPDVAGKYVLIMKDASNSYGTVWGTLEFAVEDVKKTPTVKKVKLITPPVEQKTPEKVASIPALDEEGFLLPENLPKEIVSAIPELVLVGHSTGQKHTWPHHGIGYRMVNVDSEEEKWVEVQSFELKAVNQKYQLKNISCTAPTSKCSILINNQEIDQGSNYDIDAGDTIHLHLNALATSEDSHKVSYKLEVSDSANHLRYDATVKSN